MPKTLMYFGIGAGAWLTGTALAQALPPIPIGWVKCSNCHDQSPTLCAETWCPPGSGCAQSEGQFDDGTLWVGVRCIEPPV